MGLASDQDWIDHMAMAAETAWTTAMQDEYQKSGSELSFEEWLASSGRVFAPVSDEVVLAMPVSDDLKELKLGQIRMQYAAARAGGCLLSSGIRLQCQDIDLDRWVQLTITMADLDLPEAVIRDADNRLHTVTAAQWKAMRIEMAVYVQGLLQRSWSLKDQAADATTLSDLLSVRW